MKKRKRSEMLLAAVELAAIAGILAFSFYLFYGYLQKGEQAVSSTAVNMEMDEETENGSFSDNESVFLTENGLDDDSTDAMGDRIVTREETADITVRVRILNDSYLDELFDKITVCSSDGLSVENGICEEDGTFVKTSGKETTEADEEYVIAVNELALGDVRKVFSLGESMLTVTGLSRADGSPEYSGELYIYRLENGLALVNELPLEEYLYAVVSSEMPSYYPEEAQKAQAVCARTYALQCIEERRSSMNTDGDTAADGDLNEKKLADLNDSASFQVYNNRKSTDVSVNAVEATRGEVLLTEEAQYYSTSVLSEHRDDLNEEDAFRTFLEEDPEKGAEYDSPWLRWQVQIPATQILQNLEEQYAGQYENIVSSGEISENTEVVLEAVIRSGSGQVQTLAVTVGNGTIEIEGEYAIRQLLAPGDAAVRLLDGTTVSGMQLLPSAFFYMEKTVAEEPDTEEEGMPEKEMASDTGMLSIYGGGYGHGNGMSQCGAAQMAENGATYLDILEYYYGNSG